MPVGKPIGTRWPFQEHILINKGQRPELEGAATGQQLFLLSWVTSYQIDLARVECIIREKANVE